MSRSGHRRSSRRSDRRASTPTNAGPALPFDAVTEGLLYALLVFAPLAFGTTQAWSREVFLLLVAGAAATVAAKHVAVAWAPDRFGDATARPAGYRWSWTYPLMVAFLALCLVQAVPLPAAWVRAVSPATVRLKTDLLWNLPAGLLDRVTVSFYPYATHQQTILVAAVVAIFVIVLDVYRDAVRIRRLLSVVAAVGLAVAGLAAYQNLTGATTIYGLVPAAHRHSGPFENYSHFSQFMNLSIGAALALLLDRLVDLSDYYRSPGELWAALRQPRNAAVWAWAALCVLGPITILLSMSRMGMISLFLAAAVSGAMLVWRGRSPGQSGGASGRAWLLVGLGLVVFAISLAVGFDAVYARLASVQDVRTTGRRGEMLRDMTAEFRQFPLLGTGLGTHEFVFGMYDRRALPTLATHAENEYAQLMEETGLVGVLLAAAFVALVAGSYWRATRHPTEPIGYVPFGLGFGLIAILIHSTSDFGQHVPAVAALTATFAALLTNLARRRDEAPAVPPAGRRWLPVVGHGVGLAVVVVAGVAVGVWADRARAAESLWSVAQDRAAELAAADWHGSDQAYIDLLTPAAAAVAREPGDVEYRYWTDAYRWHLIARDADAGTGGTGLPAEALPFAAQLVDDLDGARALCPTYGQPLCVAGQINLFVLGRTELGEREISTSYQLAPYDPTVCLIAGLAAAHEDHWDTATRMLGHYVELGGSIRDFADVCLRAGQPIILYRLTRHDRAGLLYLASRMPPGDPTWAAWIARCQSDAAALLAADAARPDAAPEVLAE